MSTPGPGYPQQTVIVNQPASNGLGMAGLIVSIIGFFTCGFISPIGFLLSVFGLFKQPRGAAIAGFILGGIGSLWLVFGGFAIVAGFVGLGAAINEGSKLATMGMAATEINRYYAENGALPSEADGSEMVARHQIDGVSLRYRQLSDDKFEIQGAGADGQFDTGDDRKLELTATQTVDEFPIPEPDSGESGIDVSP